MELDVFKDEDSIMQPGDWSLESVISGCPKFCTMCPTGESYYDLLVLEDDVGGGMDELVGEELAFAGLIARAQTMGEDLIECTGDDRQLQIQINPQGHGT